MTVNIACIQTHISPLPKENLHRYEQGIAQASQQGAKIVVLPELFDRPYFCQTEDPLFFDWAQPLTGPDATNMNWGQAVSLQHSVILVLPFFEKRKGIYHNTVAVWDSGSLAGIYRKMHIPEDPGYHEKFYFTPGDLGFSPIETSQGKLGILICWDQWFPEAARIMALKGADCLIYPTAIGWDPKDSPEEQSRQLEAWRLIQRSHAVANGIPVISCNRVGFEPSPQDATQGSQFWGASFVAGPQGEYWAQMNTSEAGLLICGVDFSASTAVRRIWPYLRDRRIDAYQDLQKRWVD